MVLEYMIEVETSCFLCCDIGGRWTEMCHFRKTVHTDKDGVRSS